MPRVPLLIGGLFTAVVCFATPTSVAEAIKLLTDGTLAEQCEAVEYLGAAGDEAAVPFLVAALADEDDQLRQHAAIALGEIGSPEAVPALIRALRDRDRAVQWFAAVSLAKIGEPAVEPLINELSAGDVNGAAGAAVALGRMREASAVEPLVALLSSPDLYLRGQAVEALVAIGRPATPALVKAALGNDPVKRNSALIALGRLADGDAARPLISLLGTQDLVARHYAVVALRGLGPTAVPALEEALDSPLPAVRKGACEILGYLREPRAVKSVAVLLDDPDESVRSCAAKTLGAIDGKAAAESLVAALNDPSPRVREVAVLALGKIKSQDAVPALKEVAANDPDPTVRAAAAEALAAIAGRK